MLFPVTQRIPAGTQQIYLNSDNIERVIPWKGGSLVDSVGGSKTETMETPDELVQRIKE